MNLRIVFKFKYCNFQFPKTKVVLLFQCESWQACQLLAPLLETKTRKINSFKIIIGFFFTPPLFLATKVAISFVYYSPKTIKCTQKPKIEKKVYRNRPIERASERVPFSTSYLQLALTRARNSRVKIMSSKIERSIEFDCTIFCVSSIAFNLLCRERFDYNFIP